MKRRETDEPEGERPPGANELTYLRETAGVPRPRHATLLGHKSDSLLRKCESGNREFSRDAFVAFVEPIGHGPEAVDVMLALYPVLKHLPPAEPPSPVALRQDQLVRVDRACLGAAAGLLEGLRPLMIREAKRIKAEAARQEAEAAWAELRDKGWKERRNLVDTWPVYRTWAVAARVCDASIKAAAHRADLALELATFAIYIADRVEESYRARTAGYCWAHFANAKRVGEDFDGADRAFVHAWNLWRAGAGSDPDLLPEWRMHSLEASLRRAQHRFPAASECLDRAQACCGRDREGSGRILLKRANVCEQMGDFEAALEVLEEAAPLLEGAEDARLLSVLSFNRVDLLCRLRRFKEAADLLPGARELAIALANDLDLTRLKWLDAKSRAGMGRKNEAIELLEEVCGDFAARQHPYDAALSALDLAVHKIEAGLAAQVKWLAAGLAWIFRLKKMDQEALVALRLFYDAALQGTATVELTRQVIADIERVRRSAPRPDEWEGPRGVS
ncbi:MAG: tetratricopeptide repeat protein [Thermoanaerobaculia bacterium]